MNGNISWLIPTKGVLEMTGVIEVTGVIEMTGIDWNVGNQLNGRDSMEMSYLH